MSKRFSISWRLVVGGVLALAMAGVAPSAASAQEKAEGQRRSGHMGRGGRMGGAGLALQQLDLTDAQRQQVRSIMQSHRTEFKAVGERTRAARQKLRAASTGGEANESAIRSASSELGEAQADAAVLRARVHQEVLAVLTDEQREKARTLQAERERRMEERRQRFQERLKQRGQGPAQ